MPAPWRWRNSLKTIVHCTLSIRIYTPNVPKPNPMGTYDPVAMYYLKIVIKDHSFR